MRVMGCDIGGANTKVAVITVDDEGEMVELSKAKSYYFPFWERKQEFPQLMYSILLETPDIDAIAVTITAELSDCFTLKEDGIKYIVDTLESITGKCRYLSVHGSFYGADTAKNRWLEVSASNWGATSLIVGQKYPDAILVDCGSTTTDIIPLKDGLPFTEGKTDLSRLIAGELVFTGVVRSNVAGIVHQVPFQGKNVSVANEYFACAGDVHVVLGHLQEEDYLGTTPDGGGKTPNDCLARLARIVCADVSMLTEEELFAIAQTIFDKQVELIYQGLEKVQQRLDKGNSSIGVITGLGGGILAEPALKRAKITQIRNLTGIFGPEGDAISPAVCAALLLGQTLEK